MIRYLRIALMASIVVLGCSGGGRSDDTKSDDAPETKVQQTAIAPDNCRLTGTIVSISDQRSGDANSPCGKAPCVATVRIDSVLGYGSSFGPPFSSGDEIVMNFRFTLSPTTKDLFPNMDATYPGLDVGTSFKADVRSTTSLSSKGDAAQYSVSDYQIIND